jgi:hypothetical protein
MLHVTSTYREHSGWCLRVPGAEKCAIIPAKQTNRRAAMSGGILAIILIGIIALAALVWWLFGRD